jgi:hypothetical protein
MPVIMPRRNRPEDFDMTPDGRFIEPPAAPWAARVFRYAVLAAVIAGCLALAGLVLWFALLLIPIAFAAALVAWAAFRWRLWKQQRRSDVGPYNWG